MIDSVAMVEREAERIGQLLDEQERLRNRTYGRTEESDVTEVHNQALVNNIAGLPEWLRRAASIAKSERPACSKGKPTPVKSFGFSNRAAAAIWARITKSHHSVGYPAMVGI